MCRWCPGRRPPERLFGLKNPLVVGLTVSPDRLVQIRRNRLDGPERGARLHLYRPRGGARRDREGAPALFERHGWPTIDVTRRSVEETAAAVINLLNERRARTGESDVGGAQS